jgi:type IV pilus assembly protein PilM
MPNQERPILGVDLRSDEIRVVEIRGGWAQPYIVRADAVATPAGSMEHGQVINPQAISDALRHLVQRLGTTTRDVAMGLSARAVTARTMEIPNVPDAEIPAILEGEMAHYHLQREGESSFGYTRIDSGALATANRMSVLLMSAASTVASGYREVCTRAGLRLVALEPRLVSQFRASFHGFGDGSVACLTVDATRSDIIVANDGIIRIYRRVDIGADDLIPGRKKALDAEPVRPPDNPSRPGVSAWPTDFSVRNPGVGELAFDVPDADEDFAAVPPGGQVPAHIQSLTALLLEMQRSLDYFRRSFPNLDPVTKVVLAGSDPALEPVATSLSHDLGIEVELASPPPADPVSPLAVTGAIDARFLAAAGLAMRQLPGIPEAVPQIDLSTKDRAVSTDRAERNKLGLSLAASIVILAIGIGIAFAFGNRANLIEHELGHEHEHLASLQRTVQQQGVELQAQITRLDVLKPRGIPLARIMDAVTNAIPPDARLTSIALDPNGHVQVVGEASNESAMIATVRGLRASTFIENPLLESFGSTPAGKDTAPMVQFQISGQVASAPASPPARTATGTP